MDNTDYGSIREHPGMPANVFRAFQKWELGVRRNAPERINDGYFTNLSEVIVRCSRHLLQGLSRSQKTIHQTPNIKSRTQRHWALQADQSCGDRSSQLGYHRHRRST